MSFRSFPPSWPVALTLLLFAASPAAAATIIHVPIDQPTIQAAINAAATGDTIIVSDGTYTENIDFKGKAITLKSANGPATTIIDGGNTSCVVKFVTGETSATVLTDFTIQHGFASASCGSDGAGILVANASPTIARNIIANNHGCNGVGIGVSFGSPLIQDNLITQNQQTTCSGGTGGGGIGIRGASSAQIIGNTITNNNAGNGVGGGGISLFAAGTTIIRGNLISGNIVGTSGGAIGMVNDSTPVISNNVIIRNSAPNGGGIAALVPSGSTGPSIINNTLAGNTATSKGSELYIQGFVNVTQIWNNVLFGTSAQAAVVCDTTFNATPPVLRFNDGFNTTGPAYAGSCANVTGTNGNISADPLFVSAASDFHLNSTSPAIDAGSNTAPNLPSTDFAANPRVFDGNGDGTATVDMGAYELAIQVSLALAPTSLTFPGQIVGSPGSPQTLTLTNTGDVPITLSQVAVTGDFSQTNTCGASVTPGASCTFQVTFTATQVGSRTGALTITDNAPGSPQSVALTGTGQSFSLALAPTSLTFPGQIIGSPGSPQTVTLTNTGDVPITLSQVDVTGDFSQTNTCGASVIPGASCTFQVTFRATQAGSSTGALTIMDNAPGSPHSVALTGTGQDFSIEVMPGSATSAAIEAGDTATYHLQVSPAGGFADTVTLTCSGAPDGADCTVSPAQVTPSGAASPFTVSVANSVATGSAAGATSIRTPPVVPGAIVVALALISVGFLVRGAAPSRRRMRSLLVPTFTFVLAGSFAFSGCGDNEQRGIPAGTYELTITGTANGRTHTLSLPLTVR